MGGSLESCASFPAPVLRARPSRTLQAAVRSRDGSAVPACFAAAVPQLFHTVLPKLHGTAASSPPQVLVIPTSSSPALRLFAGRVAASPGLCRRMEALVLLAWMLGFCSLQGLALLPLHQAPSSTRLAAAKRAGRRRAASPRFGAAAGSDGQQPERSSRAATRRQGVEIFSHYCAPWLCQSASLPPGSCSGFLIAFLTLLLFFCWQCPEARSPPGALALACQN